MASYCPCRCVQRRKSAVSFATCGALFGSFILLLYFFSLLWTKRRTFCSISDGSPPISMLSPLNTKLAGQHADPHSMIPLADYRECRTQKISNCVFSTVNTHISNKSFKFLPNVLSCFPIRHFKLTYFISIKALRTNILASLSTKNITLFVPISSRSFDFSKYTSFPRARTRPIHFSHSHIVVFQLFVRAQVHLIPTHDDEDIGMSVSNSCVGSGY